MTKIKNPPFEDPIFQIKVVALLLSKPEILENYIDLVKPEFVYISDYRQVAQLTFDHFKNYGEPPPLDDLNRLLSENEKVEPYNSEGWEGVVQEIRTAIEEENLTPIQNQLMEWIQYSVSGPVLRTAFDFRLQGEYGLYKAVLLNTINELDRLDEGLIGSNGKPKRSLLGLGFRSKGVKNVNGVGERVPELHPAALFGIAGQLVRAIEPFTESHPAALLAIILVFFGNIIGKGPHWIAEATRHSLNLFIALVGDTSRGRKGTAQGHGEGLFNCLDEAWVKNNIVSGLSSGEGLIYRVRDKVEIEEDGEIKVIDPGVKDKKIVVVESELAQILKVITREGNTLSTKIRQAWDSGNMSTMTRKNPIKATDAQISIIAHISKEELLRGLREQDALSGFGNRFMWLHTYRTRELPSGGNLKELNEILAPLKNELSKVYNWARLQRREIKRSKKAEQYWASLYTVLTKDYPGRFGAITARAEAQTMRLASIYALLDKSIIIKPQHLAAAYAFWKYAEDSCRYIFGASLGDPNADAIISAVRDKPGITRTEIRVEVFQRNKKASEINPVLQSLVDCELIVEVKSKNTGGAPSTRYFHMDHYQGDSSPDTKECTPLTPLANKVALQLLNKATQLYGDQPVKAIQSNGDLRNAITPPKGSITQKGKELSEEIKKAMKAMKAMKKKKGLSEKRN